MWLVYDMEGQSDNVKMVDSEYQLKESESYVSYHDTEDFSSDKANPMFLIMSPKRTKRMIN